MVRFLISMRASPARADGSCEDWLRKASAPTKRLSAEVNGPMLKCLAKIAQAKNRKAVETFRKGLLRCHCCALLCTLLLPQGLTFTTRMAKSSEGIAKPVTAPC